MSSPPFSSSCFDVVKAEKADAMRRFRRERNCRLFLRVFVALLFLLCAFNSFPTIPQLVSDHFSCLSLQLRAFLLLNAVVGLIVFFSSINNGRNDLNDNVFLHQPDLYDEYVSYSARRKTNGDEDKQLVVSPAALPKDEEEEVVQDKRILLFENASTARPMAVVEENPVRELTVTNVVYSVEKLEKKPYRRTRSEVGDMKSRSSTRKELRRSETEKGREVAVVGEYAVARKSMEEMNNEEFRMAVERFIESKKKILRDENMSFSSQDRTRPYISITSTST